MAEIAELTKAYITAAEALFKAEDELEQAFEAAKAALPERAVYRQAGDALSRAVEATRVLNQT